MQRKALITAMFATFAGIPAISQAIQLTDYIFPDSQWEEAYIRGSASSQSGNQDQASYNLYMEGDYQYNFTSLPQNWSFNAAGFVDMKRGGNDNDKQEKNYEANAHGTVDTYFDENEKLFWYGSGDVGYKESADDMYFQVGAGIGYGRVINATPLAFALRIVEELREHGVISGDVSDATYIAMAQVIDRENEFSSKYGLEEYEPMWYKEIEAVLNEAGVLANNALGADGVLHMRRILEDEPIGTRKHGWVVRGGAGYVIQDYNGQDSDPSLNAQFEYAMPIGLQSQFINVLSYSSIFADNTDHLFTNAMTYTYEISDRIDWNNGWNLTHQISGGDAEDFTTNLLSSSIDYYLTNTLTAGVGVSAYDNGIDGSDWDIRTMFNISYRLK